MKILNPKKQFYLVLFLIFVSCSKLFSQEVSIHDVLKVTQYTLKKENQTDKNVEKIIPLGLKNDTTIYILTFDKGGFVIISGDYTAPPVLGFCNNGTYNPDSLPGGLSYLIEGYQRSINNLRENKIKQTDEIQSKWSLYTKDFSAINNLKSITSSKLLTLDTKWQQGVIGPNQSSSYNRFCPTNCLAGCVAVAMAQILYFWKWDVNQQGIHTYDGHTINFDFQSYCYDDMNLTVSDVNNSRLIYHAGVSCNTNYCGLGNQSGATVSNARTAFVEHWGMSSAAYTKQRYWIQIPSWKSRLMGSLDHGQPILYGGGAHAWVINGYDDDDKFHCIWGAFDGDLDNYYSLGGFEPNGNDYNSDEIAIFDIHPATPVIYEITGPDVVTGTSETFYIENIADCKYAYWEITPNLQAVYGSNHWYAVKAISGGIGWLDAYYVLNGQKHYAPRKYVTCLP